MPSALHDMRPNPKERVLLVGITKNADSLNELAQLADTAGGAVVGHLIQMRSKPNPATYLGKGKVRELSSRVQDSGAQTVIFDDDLSPSQIRNLERELECKLVDRSQLILDIFADRAKTAVAKTQVELAQLDYLRTRLTRHWTHLSRQQGGIGTRGPGETQIETDRRLIGQRMATLRSKLQKINRQRTTQRRRRAHQFQVSLVGYTNAGKSTLLNALAGSHVFAEDRLFATLDTTTRKVVLGDSVTVLLSDTVGFIRKLPHRLIESFKSTLDEVRLSDVLLHVVDAAHSNYGAHMHTVRATIADIGAHELPTVLVFNQIDRLHARPDVLAALRREYPDAELVSATRGIGLQALTGRLRALALQTHASAVAYIPVTDGRALARLRQVGVVQHETLVRASANGGTACDAIQVRYRASDRAAAELRSTLEPYQSLELAHESPE